MKEKSRTKVSFVVSLVLHALALFAIVGGFHACGVNGSQNRQNDGNAQNEIQSEEKQADNNNIPGSIQDKQVEVELVERPPMETAPDGTEPQTPPEQSPGLLECEGNRWFGGIGVTYSRSMSGDRGVIETVHHGYPAERAGLKRGDIIAEIIKSDTGVIRGEPGTPVTFRIIRPSTQEEVVLTLIRERICYDDIRSKTTPQP